MDDNMKALEDLEDVMRQMDTNEVRILRQEVETMRAQMSILQNKDETIRAQMSILLNTVESLLDRELAPRSNEEQEYVPVKVGHDPAVG